MIKSTVNEKVHFHIIYTFIGRGSMDNNYLAKNNFIIAIPIKK